MTSLEVGTSPAAVRFILFKTVSQEYQQWQRPVHRTIAQLTNSAPASVIPFCLARTTYTELVYIFISTTTYVS